MPSHGRLTSMRMLRAGASMRCPSARVGCAAPRLTSRCAAPGRACSARAPRCASCRAGCCALGPPWRAATPAGGGCCARRPPARTPAPAQRTLCESPMVKQIEHAALADAGCRALHRLVKRPHGLQQLYDTLTKNTHTLDPDRSGLPHVAPAKQTHISARQLLLTDSRRMFKRAERSAPAHQIRSHITTQGGALGSSTRCPP